MRLKVWHTLSVCFDNDEIENEDTLSLLIKLKKMCYVSDLIWMSIFWGIEILIILSLDHRVFVSDWLNW